MGGVVLPKWSGGGVFAGLQMMRCCCASLVVFLCLHCIRINACVDRLRVCCVKEPCSCLCWFGSIRGCGRCWAGGVVLHWVYFSGISISFPALVVEMVCPTDLSSKDYVLLCVH